MSSLLVINFIIHLFLISFDILLLLQKEVSPNITLLIILRIKINLFKFFSSKILSNSLPILLLMKSSWNLISENKSHIVSLNWLSPSPKISNNKLNCFSSKQNISSFF